MERTYYSSVCPMCEVEDALLTKEKIDEISNRISAHVSNEIFKQLKKALALPTKQSKK